MTANKSAAPKNVKATINYHPTDGPKVIRPGTAGYQRRKYDPRVVTITDIRGSEDDFKFDKDGFQLVRHPWAKTSVDDDEKHVKEIVYPETVDMLKQLTGATSVVPFSYLMRSQSAEQVRDAANGLEDSAVLTAVGPAQFAHCDNSDVGAVPVLKENIPSSEFDARTKHRWAIVNVWRPLARPVTREPLALLSANSVANDELVGVPAAFPKPGQGAFDSIYNAGQGFETAMIKANPTKHQWYYASNLTPEEALVFKQYDSKRDGRARRTPHSAFQCEDDSGPPRQSIEVRNLVFWEDEAVE